MAIKKFERRQCDRCGATAEMPDDGISRHWQNVGFPTEHGFTGCGDMPPRFDLCPDCRGSLIQWWRDKRKPARPLVMAEQPPEGPMQ